MEANMVMDAGVVVAKSIPGCSVEEGNLARVIC